MMHRLSKNLRIPRRRGFSFVEVMFAVIILGIGFIMVSAMFPVAIQQTQMNVEDAAVGRVYLAAQSNFTVLEQDLVLQTKTQTLGGVNNTYYGWPLTLAPLVPPPATAVTIPGKVFSFRDVRWASFTAAQQFPTYTPPAVIPPILAANYASQFPLYSSAAPPAPPLQQVGLWDRVRGNMISPAEPQFAYVPMFQRGLSYNPTTALWTADSKVNFYVFLATARNRTPYSNATPGTHSDVFRNPGETAGDTVADNVNPPASLEPRLVGVRFHIHGDTADPAADLILDTIDITSDATNGQASSPAAAGPGGFVLISDDNPPPGTINAANAGAVNGATVQLGAQRTANTGALFTFELQPGHDFSALSGQQQLLFQTGGALRLVYIDAFILGRQLQNPDQPFGASNPYDGPVQDLAIQQLPSITIK